MRICVPGQCDGEFGQDAEASQFEIRQFVFGDAPRLIEIQAACLRVCKDTDAFTPGFFHDPRFEGGRNIFCAVDAVDEMLGYVAVSPRTVSTNFGDATDVWLDLRVDPACDDAALVRDRLLARAIVRAREIGTILSTSRVALSVTYLASGRASIEYLMSKGFAGQEHVSTLQRDLSIPFMAVPVPQDVEIRPWRMDTELARRNYLRAYTVATGDRSWDLETLQRFMKSEFWAVGTTFVAFHDGEIVGSALVWYDPNLMRNKPLIGRVERIFVKSAWRGRGIVQRLLNESAAYLRRRGMSTVELTVAGGDQLILAMYESLGYRVVKEEVTLALLLD